ncbi:MAG: AAA family ATPase [Phycisphaeraceae bacterium]|nr:AAA family ATPase [Phycisphaeraceae bacterium]
MATAVTDTDSPVHVNGLSRAPILKERLQRIRDALCDGLIERDIPIRLALLAALSGEHLLLIGPPGTAKSELARRLRLAFTGQAYFERLLTRFSVPEELFGPLSIKALDEDKYQRQTDGYLPTASVAFLDEIFKANSAILNALLTLLNEREFDNGTQRVKTPLVSVVGASNELPQEEELLALYDRFLVRCHVGPVTEEGFDRLLDLRGQAKPCIPDADRLTSQDIEHIHAAALKVTVPAEVASLLKAMRKFCQDQKIPVSDRRWRKAIFLLQVAAHTDGRSAVSVWDCWLLQHCLWHKPEQLTDLFEWYTARIGEATVQDPGQLGKHVAAWEERLRGDRETGPHKKDMHGHRLFIGADGKQTTESHRYDNRQQVENKPVIETRHYTARHIRKRTEGVRWVCEQIAAGQAALNAVAADVEQAVRSHNWLDTGFVVPAQRCIAQQRQLLSSLDGRAKAAISGFESLPQKSSTLPAELAALPPSMLQAFKTLAAFVLSKQRLSGKPLEEALTVQVRHDAWGNAHWIQVSVKDEDKVPPAVREAIDVLQFSLKVLNTRYHEKSHNDTVMFKTYLKLLREYLVIDKAPDAIFRRLDGIEALVATDDATGDGSESVEHIVGMVQAIRYGNSDRNGESLTQRFNQFWSKSLATGASRFFDWVALGLLTDED